MKQDSETTTPEARSALGQSELTGLVMCDVPNVLCLRCKTRYFKNELINNAWSGWRIVDGKTQIVPVANYCCPDPACGSNDLLCQDTQPEGL